MTNISVNDRFFSLTVISPEFTKRSHNRTEIFVKCKCDCGKETIVRTYRLLNGHTKSCGHLRGIAIAKVNKTHGLSRKVSEYAVWKSMRQRCNNPKSTFYCRYGGRGITICDEWNDFSKFYSDMGSRPSPAHTLERKNNNGNYCKANCEWATRAEQSVNTSHCVYLEFDGQILTMSQWTRKLSLPKGLIFGRLRKGWSVNRTLTEPVNVEYRNNKWTKKSC